MKITKRAAGVLLPLFSLPSQEGRGCLDSSAFKFIDWLHSTHQSYWQLLPIGPTFRYGNPYSAYSSFGGDPAYLSIQRLYEKEFISALPPQIIQSKSVTNLAKKKSQFILQNLTWNKQHQKSFQQFIDNNSEWIYDFAVFSMLSHMHGKQWTRWKKELRIYSKDLVQKLFLTSEAQNIAKIQWLFFQQWIELHLYARAKGIQLIGDIPIYVDRHSVDLWPHPQLFKLDKQGNPQFVSGAPPDQFSETGQIWNTPVFNWTNHQQENFAWWKRRIAHLFDLFDIVRIDHFRGLVAYWETPNDKVPDARKGRWVTAPGKELFTELLKQDDYALIVEDLGDIDEPVRKLRDDLALPGMKILQFAFDGRADNEYLAENIPINSLVYTGTHDNDSILSWLQANRHNNQFLHALKKFAGLQPNPNFHWDIINYAFNTKANTAIIPMADILGLEKNARINVPGTVKGNWNWQFNWKQLTPAISQKLKEVTNAHNRSPL